MHIYIQLLTLMRSYIHIYATASFVLVVCLRVFSCTSITTPILYDFDTTDIVNHVQYKLILYPYRIDDVTIHRIYVDQDTYLDMLIYNEIVMYYLYFII